MNGRPWTPQEDAQLRKLFPHISSAKVAKCMRVSVIRITARAKRLDLRKTQKYLDSPDACRLRRGDHVGKEFRYPKGHVPANKGLRRPGFAPGRMATTQFSRGGVPHNTLPLWSFRINTDGYLLLKTGKPGGKPNNGWEFVHKLVWEQAHGPLPDWRVARIWWKDRDRSNCSLSNLELVSSQEHMARTTIHNYPPELKRTIFQAGVLKRRIREYEEAHG